MGDIGEIYLQVRLDEQRQLVGVAQVREVGSTLERRELGAIGQRGKELVRVRARVRTWRHRAARRVAARAGR